MIPYLDILFLLILVDHLDETCYKPLFVPVESCILVFL